MDLKGGLGLPPGHGRSLLSFTQVVLIKKRIILELQRLPLCLGPGSPADGWLGWGTAGGQGSTPDSLVRAPLQVFAPTGRASPEGPREGAVWSHSGPRSVPKSFQRSLPRCVRGQVDPAVTAAFDPKAQEGLSLPCWGLRAAAGRLPTDLGSGVSGRSVPSGAQPRLRKAAAACCGHGSLFAC